MKIPQSPTRRAFLRSSSALLTLPFLESFGAKQFQYAAASAAATPPKRMMFLSFGWGPTKESWYPDINTTGSNYTLPAGLKGLMRHKKDLTIIQKLTKIDLKVDYSNYFEK